MGSSISTYIHEFIHWRDAITYIRKHGKIKTDEDEKKYFAFLNKKAKKELDKRKQKGYDIYNISDYASLSYDNGNFDETYTEYRTKLKLEE